MMLVKILGFGSNWWARFGRDPDDWRRYTKHAAYFNSTGLRCGNKVRRYWTIPGLIRFNGVGDFQPQFPRRSVGATFECTDLVFALGGNRMLFQRKAPGAREPQWFLTIISSESHGTFDWRTTTGWKSDSVMPIAVSESGTRQEAMLLMRPLDWVRTTLGVFTLTSRPDVAQGVALELLDGGVDGRE